MIDCYDLKEKLAIEEFLPYIRHASLRLGFRLPPCLSADDLMQEGVVALIENIRRQDDDKDSKSKGPSKIRIRGAMLDSIRHMKHGRKSPQTAYPVEFAFESHPPLPDISQENINPEESLETKQIIEMIETLRMQLPKQLRTVLCLRYQWDFTFEYIGELLGLSKMRSSQLHKEALDMLKKKIKPFLLSK